MGRSIPVHTLRYQLQWTDPPWTFYEETSDGGVDSLVLFNGYMDASFLLAFAPGMTLDDFVGIAMSDPMIGVSDVELLLNAQGAPVAGTSGTQEWAVYTGMQAFDDGTVVEFVQYFNVRPLDGGVMLLMSGSTVSFFWDERALQAWQDLADTILVGNVPGPDPTATTDPLVPPTSTPFSMRPDPDVSSTAIPVEPTAVPVEPTAVPVEPTAVPTEDVAPPSSGEGEPAPAFAAGPWRVSVRAVDLGESIGYLGLEATVGQQWVVVYADITNWSAENATLAVADVMITGANGSIAPDAAGTQATATQLGLEPANGSSVSVPAGSSTRLALVYQVPATEPELILEIAGSQLPLADAVGQQLDVTDLSTIATPPAIETAVLTTAFGGPEFMTLTVDTGETGAGPTTIRLAGVEFPTSAACFDAALAMMSLSGLDGSNVRLERDPAVTEANAYYVWIENPLGHWELLNQTLIVKGVGIEGDLPEAARFGAWLEQTDALARAQGSGLWAACAGRALIYARGRANRHGPAPVGNFSQRFFVALVCDPAARAAGSPPERGLELPMPLNRLSRRTMTRTLLASPALFLRGVPAAAEESTPESGGRYGSEQFGYEITWTAPWTMTTTVMQAGDYDMVTLVNDEATVQITISRPGDTPLSDIVESLAAGPDERTFVPGMVATDQDGNEILGETRDHAWGAWEGNYVDEEIDGFMEFRYAEVRRLEADLVVGLSYGSPAGISTATLPRFPPCSMG